MSNGSSVAGVGPMVPPSAAARWQRDRWYDYLTRGRVHPAALWGGVFLVASQVLRIAVSGTDAWLAFAAWIMG